MKLHTPHWFWPIVVAAYLTVGAIALSSHTEFSRTLAAIMAIPLVGIFFLALAAALRDGIRNRRH